MSTMCMYICVCVCIKISDSNNIPKNIHRHFLNLRDTIKKHALI